MDLILVAGGLALLVLAGHALVRGAVATSLRFRVPPFIVSLVIVGFGTSAPELLVSVQSMLNGSPALALGNVVGSNIANVLLVLGLSLAIAPIAAAAARAPKEVLQMVFASAIFIGFCFFGTLTALHGLVLLALLCVMLWLAIRQARRHREDTGDDDVPLLPGWKMAALLAGGLIGLPLGAQLMVEGAQNIARDFGIPERVIGLTLVAVGTSLPELAASVIAAFRRHAEIALGNVLGSNLFNLLAIMGITLLIGPVPVDDHMLRVDLWVMLGAAAVMLPFCLKGIAMPRLLGVGFLAGYAGYMISLF